MIVTVYLKIENPLNGSHGRSMNAVHAIKRRAKKEVQQTTIALFAARPPTPGPPYRVRLTRVVGYRGRSMDDDGMVAGFKHVRDATAAYLGLDDKRGSGIEWEYDERRGEMHGVEIEIRPG